MSNPGDALQNTKHIGSSSDSYHAFMLLKERLAVHGDDRLSADAKLVLGAVSQKEQIKFHILKKITSAEFGESSASYALLEKYTEGRTDKLDQADFLANKVFAKMEAAQIMKALVGDSKAEYSNIFSQTGGANTFSGGEGIGAAIVRGFSSFLPK